MSTSTIILLLFIVAALGGLGWGVGHLLGRAIKKWWAR